jgi:hypothetical protein
MTWEKILKEDDYAHYMRGGETEDRLEEHYDEHSDYRHEGGLPTYDEIIDDLLTMREDMMLGRSIEEVLGRIDNGAKQRQKMLDESGRRTAILIREIKEMGKENFNPNNWSDKNRKFYFEEMNKLPLHIYTDIRRIVRNFR